LWRSIVEHRAAHIVVTPLQFSFLDSLDAVQRQPHALKTVALCGEKLEPRQLARWGTRHPPGQPRLLNMYGITETTIMSTVREITKEDLANPAMASRGVVGPPLPCAGFLVLHPRYHNPTPLGVRGELCLIGPVLSPGYLNDPAMTSKKFVRPPPSLRPLLPPGTRMYKSGDWAVATADGEVEVLGRIDLQMSVRGYRVEPAEVEAALCAQRGVRHAAVVQQLPPDLAVGVVAKDVLELVAFVILQPDATATAASVRDAASAALPAHMVPDHVILIDEFPLTHSGKVDKKALASGTLNVPSKREQPPRTRPNPTAPPKSFYP